jgi:hypothetical protein
VPFTPGDVQRKAKSLAEMGFSFMNTIGTHCIYSQCYSSLADTDTKTIVVLGTVIDRTDIEDVPEFGVNKRRGINYNRRIGLGVNENDFHHKDNSKIVEEAKAREAMPRKERLIKPMPGRPQPIIEEEEEEEQL